MRSNFYRSCSSFSLHSLKHGLIKLDLNMKLVQVIRVWYVIQVTSHQIPNVLFKCSGNFQVTRGRCGHTDIVETHRTSCYASCSFSNLVHFKNLCSTLTFLNIGTFVVHLEDLMHLFFSSDHRTQFHLHLLTFTDSYF